LAGYELERGDDIAGFDERVPHDALDMTESSLLYGVRRPA
jgi:hypothetical protein